MVRGGRGLFRQGQRNGDAVGSFPTLPFSPRLSLSCSQPSFIFCLSTTPALIPACPFLPATSVRRLQKPPPTSYCTSSIPFFFSILNYNLSLDPPPSFQPAPSYLPPVWEGCRGT